MNREYNPNDFRNGNAVKWCAGCGDHAIFNSVLKALPEVAERLDIPRENFAFTIPETHHVFLPFRR